MQHTSDSVKAHHMGAMDPIVGCCYRVELGVTILVTEGIRVDVAGDTTLTLTSV